MTHFLEVDNLRHLGNPLSNVPCSDHVQNVHTKIHYMLKDTLGVVYARVLEVDYTNQQLVALGEQSKSVYPLSSKSISAKVVETGRAMHLQNPINTSEFNRHIDGSGVAGLVEDLLIFPVLASSDRPMNHNNGCRPGQSVIAVCQVCDMFNFPSIC